MAINLNRKFSFKQLFSKVTEVDYPLNPTKNEIRNVFSGTRKVKHGRSIHSASRHLRRNEGTSPVVTGEFIKKRQGEILRKHLPLIKISSFPVEIGKGMEHKVYGYDKRTVVKTNNLYYYSSWHHYFNNLLLHNYFFQGTAYELIGLAEENGKLLSVVKQPYIKFTETTDLNRVRKLLSDLGFTSDEDFAYNYISQELGVILEDLHSKNVLTQENPETKKKVLYFIDTIFRALPSLYD